MGKMLGQDNAYAKESSSTKLYKEDWLEVQSYCVGGQSESQVIRELVRKGLQREHYRRAASDPAIRELLRTFDEMVSHRLSEVEARIRGQAQAESSAACKFLIEMMPAIMFTGNVLGALPSDLAPDDLREKALDFYQDVYTKSVQYAKSFTEDTLKARASRVAALDQPAHDTEPTDAVCSSEQAAPVNKRRD